MMRGQRLRWLAAVVVLGIGVWALIHYQPWPSRTPAPPADYLAPPTPGPSPARGWLGYVQPSANALPILTPDQAAGLDELPWSFVRTEDHGRTVVVAVHNTTVRGALVTETPHSVRIRVRGDAPPTAGPHTMELVTGLFAVPLAAPLAARQISAG